MSIWVYGDNSSDDVPVFYTESVYYQGGRGPGLNACPYCCSPLSVLPESHYFGMNGSIFPEMPCLKVCNVCGYWLVFMHHNSSNAGEEVSVDYSATQGILRNLDLADIDLPLLELESYLLAKRPDVGPIHPRKYEQLVGSIFSSLGYTVRVTNYSGDRGIDLFVFDGPDDVVVGVQVKRYHGKIEAEQIRAFGGALVVNGLTKGIFITASSFRPGAVKMAKDFSCKGIAVELWDSNIFYDRMKIAQRPIYGNVEDPQAPYRPLLTDPQRLSFIRRIHVH